MGDPTSNEDAILNTAVVDPDALKNGEKVLQTHAAQPASLASVSPALIAAIGSRPRLEEAYERLVDEHWRLDRRNILVGNSDVDPESKTLYIDDDEEDDATIQRWIHEAVREAYLEQNDLRRRAILEKGLEIFSITNDLTDLESMARLYEWAAWFWVDPTGSFGDVYGFMDDMVLALTGRTPDLRSDNDQTYTILVRAGTRDESTGFKRQVRDATSQVRHATFSLQASLLYGKAGFLVAQGREVGADQPADMRLNSQCLDIAGRLLGSLASLSNIGEILRTELGDPSQTKPWDGPPGGDPDQ